MVHSRFLNIVLVIVTIASIFSTFAEANRDFGSGWGWGTGSSGSGSSPGSGWGWGSSQNGSGWGWGSGSSGSGSSPGSGWGWGSGSSGSGPSPGSGWGWGSSSSGSSPGSGWGWGSSPNGSGWGWGTGSSGSVSSPGSGWGLGSSRNGSGGGWGWGWGHNNTQNSGSGRWGWGWGPKNTNNSGSGWGAGGHSKSHSATYNAPRKIIVGGDKEWTYGVNYSDWASKTAPFFLNDILVFKYNPPAPFTHSVYLLPDPSSYEKCDVKKGRILASPKQGAGNGFEFVLTKMKPYYISSGEHDGAHCSNGTMKFTVMPIIPRW